VGGRPTFQMLNNSDIGVLPNKRMQPTSVSTGAPLGRQVPMKSVEGDDCAGGKLAACS
jgi:hypothetical protein